MTLMIESKKEYCFVTSSLLCLPIAMIMQALNGDKSTVRDIA